MQTNVSYSQNKAIERSQDDTRTIAGQRKGKIQAKKAENQPILVNQAVAFFYFKPTSKSQNKFKERITGISI